MPSPSLVNIFPSSNDSATGFAVLDAASAPMDLATEDPTNQLRFIMVDDDSSGPGGLGLILPPAVGSGRDIVVMWFGGNDNGWGVDFAAQSGEKLYWGNQGGGPITGPTSINIRSDGNQQLTYTLRDVKTGEWAVHLPAAEALENVSRVQASAAYDSGGNANGTIRFTAVPADGDSITIDMTADGGTSQQYDFVDGAPAEDWEIQRNVGGDTAATMATALAAAIEAVQGDSGSGEFFAEVHGTDGTVIDWVMMHNGRARSVTITDGTSGDVVIQSRADQRWDEQVIPFHREYTVTAEDVACGHFNVWIHGDQAGGSGFVSYSILFRSSTGAVKLVDSTVDAAADVFEFDFDGSTPCAAGDVVTIWGVAAR